MHVMQKIMVCIYLCNKVVMASYLFVFTISTAFVWLPEMISSKIVYHIVCHMLLLHKLHCTP